MDIRVLRNPNSPTFTSAPCQNSIPETQLQGSNIFQLAATDADAFVSLPTHVCEKISLLESYKIHNNNMHIA